MGFKTGRLQLYDWSVNFSFILQQNKYLSLLEPWTKRMSDMMSYKPLFFLSFGIPDANPSNSADEFI